MAKAKKLFTIGYEQTPARAVLDELEAAGVKLLVDVRAVAASRRPGFSKNQLAAGLDERGISYLHLRGLGTPKDGREAARSGSGSVLSADMLLVLGALFCTVAGYFALQPMMAAAKAGAPGTLSFAALHGVSMGLFALKALQVTLLAWRLTRVNPRPST